jgi:hypothetical protein
LPSPLTPRPDPLAIQQDAAADILRVASYENASTTDILRRRIKKQIAIYQRFEGDTVKTLKL